MQEPLFCSSVGTNNHWYVENSNDRSNATYFREQQYFSKYSFATFHSNNRTIILYWDACFLKYGARVFLQFLYNLYMCILKRYIKYVLFSIVRVFIHHTEQVLFLFHTSWTWYFTQRYMFYISELIETRNIDSKTASTRACYFCFNDCDLSKRVKKCDVNKKSDTIVCWNFESYFTENDLSSCPRCASTYKHARSL